MREREWEAAHSVWLWPDLSASMQFRSHLAPVSKAERALVLMLALGDLLIQGGERIALLGAMAPTGRRNAIHRVALAIAQAECSGADLPSLPPTIRLPRFAHCVFFSDFLEPLDAIGEAVRAFARRGVKGLLVQVLDPAEETLPYRGRIDFAASEGGAHVLAERAETLRGAYRERVEAHRAALAALAQQFEWPFLFHHTDRPPEEALLALHTQLAGLSEDYRARPARQSEGDLPIGKKRGDNKRGAQKVGGTRP